MPNTITKHTPWAELIERLDVAPEKPEHGAPCNGCGFCCAAERCQIAVEVLGNGLGPCPAMEFASGRFACGMVIHPSQYIGGPSFADEMIGGLFSEALGIGRGCDADDPPEYRPLPAPAESQENT